MRGDVRALWNLTIEEIDLETGLRQVQRTHNAVVSAGRNLIRDVFDGTAAVPSHLAVGTSSTAVSDGQTALVTEVFRGALTQKIATVTNVLTVKYYLAGASANGNTLRECGLFNAASTGTMYARALIASPITKTASKAVTFAWDLSWSV